jgi:glycosyltransferase involved in cell wall biosynthesis
MRPLLGYRWIVDAHNEAVRPFVHSGLTIRVLSQWLLRAAEATIVTNVALASDVKRAGGSALVLPDGLPRLPLVQPRRFEGSFNVLAISTFASDEPIQEILEAARLLPEGCIIHFTGNAARANVGSISLPRNVRLLGYLPEEEYWAAVLGCDVVLDLTLMPDCLVCGAYEALAAGKPMVLSDNAPSRQLFGSVAVFTVPTRFAIAEALKRSTVDLDRIAKSLPSSREQYESSWRRSVDVLRELVHRF